MAETNYCSVYITASCLREAKKISRTLVKSRMAACANIFKISSIYRWKGKIEESPEYGIILKTKKSLVREIITAVRKMHSYEVPCIVRWDIAEGNMDYLKWIGMETCDTLH